MIDIHNLSKSFDGHTVLQGIGFTIPDGARQCIIGRSGSGKSVLLQLIMGLLQPDEGTIHINGQSTQNFQPRDWRRVLDDFGVVFQQSALFDSLSVRENIGIKLYERKRLTHLEIETKIEEAIEQVQLVKTVLNKYPAQLSGGMQKRVAIARAIIDQPRYLLYDEPTTGLDPIGADLIDELILRLASVAGRTTIVVTHDMDSLRQIATDLVMIQLGEQIFNGKPADFFASDNPQIQSFLHRTNRNG